MFKVKKQNYQRIWDNLSSTINETASEMSNGHVRSEKVQQITFCCDGMRKLINRWIKQISTITQPILYIQLKKELVTNDTENLRDINRLYCNNIYLYQ
jgi:hypothetical protein